MKALLVLLFVRSDCPVSNRYAPEIQRLYTQYHRPGIEFRLVYTEQGLSEEAMARHKAEYGLTLPSALDAGHETVRLVKATVTPEAAVLLDGKLIYRGRIDDRHPALAKTRPKATRRDLEDLLAAWTAGRAPPPRITRATGCAIERRP